MISRTGSFVVTVSIQEGPLLSIREEVDNQSGQ